MRSKTQVAIIGAGPAGLLLGRLLRLSGVDNIILEARDRHYVENRLRAGLLEQPTVDLLDAAGLGDRLHREGKFHEGFELRFGGRRTRIDMRELTGRAITVLYPQTEVVKDLLAARDKTGDLIAFEVSEVEPHGIDSDRPTVRYRDAGGSAHEIQADFIAGCDGFHGVCRPAIPSSLVKTFTRDYPFAWFGILADAPPISAELIYAHHARGFSMHSMRSDRVSRLYLQVAPDDTVENWPDERIWTELQLRMGAEGSPRLNEGAILHKSITPMRSFVTEPLQYGRLFLAGDAAHIVPPTAAKGLNLAVADVSVLSDGLITFYRDGDRSILDGYSELALQRIWRAQEFSRAMTELLHHVPGQDFEARLQRARLEGLVASRAAMTTFCENYTGLPFAGRIHH
ncbi:4-hydroxybenzoate 3-monooxygenase [Enterovirga aerilata]|uniref:4-hydroxybenzoate 3-monooxygenase n=1 Tax=Enterovirga aerilata TaxID=2730920 RepID=A0A849IB82_9HYPH|nr:4-hydroxybenzoate 3-monooxygenase [Enterovirga sp. DB1703]NNM75174.1 4-hydroxybenzoate 3-monooxygenase [Enterovirga sp. DB1703]